ncbi:MAG: hypothetical protein AAF288_00705 [Planctomycetota bacterium]
MLAACPAAAGPMSFYQPDTGVTPERLTRTLSASEATLHPAARLSLLTPGDTAIDTGAFLVDAVSLDAAGSAAIASAPNQSPAAVWRFTLETDLDAGLGWARDGLVQEATAPDPGEALWDYDPADAWFSSAVRGNRVLSGSGLSVLSGLSGSF